MNLRPRSSPWFDADFHFRTVWYAERGGLELSERFVDAVEATIKKLTGNPELGRRPYRKDPDVAQLYAVLVNRPFQKHLLYYRFTSEELFLERLIHGARDLPRRLRQSPFDEDE
jgi:plasmid stabilization system protein ParE